MIKVESVHIKEVRGIREITLDLNGDTFVVYGPNGSGKSGIVDAIEFALTGEMSRLSGVGTSGISLLSHGPHVDKRDYPDASFVALEIEIPSIGKKASLKREIKNPKTPIISPDDVEVRSVLAQVASHPEITLSRREIIKFILTQATKRSQDVQTLLKLEDINQTRLTLQKARNKLATEKTGASAQLDSARDALRRHFDIPELNIDELLAAANRHRKTLGLPEIVKLEKDTSLDDGVVDSGKKNEEKEKVDKKSALADISALADEEPTLSDLHKAEKNEILEDLQQLEDDPALLAALKKSELVKTGLELIDGPQCPLCDTEWDIDHLKQHLQAKQEKSLEAKHLQSRLSKNGSVLASSAVRLQGLARAIRPTAKNTGMQDLAKALETWIAELEPVSKNAATAKGLGKIRANLVDGWTNHPEDLLEQLLELKKRVDALPQESAAVISQTFLTLAQDRLRGYRSARKASRRSEKAWAAAKATYKAYVDASELVLTGLYDQVQEDFSSSYREINRDDEGKFSAKLSPSQSKLDLEVDFYGRGMFPPGAYHSEGHQDGMGVCLYLALMKRLLGDEFTFAVLDDVVMSVDSQHRKEFCNLLKKRFPHTQFVITTHDQLWAQQMISSGLVKRKNALSFYGWTIDTGPTASAEADIWKKIDDDLEENRVPDAAAKLRRHLEFVSRELAGELVAHPPFRPDGDYDLGDLMPNVVSRYRRLLAKAAKAAQSWGNADAVEQTNAMKESFSECAAKTECENWAVNKAVHYNVWADFSRNDFEPVVLAFSTLLEKLRCSKCHSWLYVSPKKGEAESLRCECALISLNLKPK